MKTNKKNFTNHIGMYFLTFVLIVATLLSTIAIPQAAVENDTFINDDSSCFVPEEYTTNKPDYITDEDRVRTRYILCKLDDRYNNFLKGNLPNESTYIKAANDNENSIDKIYYSSVTKNYKIFHHYTQKGNDLICDGCGKTVPNAKSIVKLSFYNTDYDGSEKLPTVTDVTGPDGKSISLNYGYLSNGDWNYNNSVIIIKDFNCNTDSYTEHKDKKDNRYHYYGSDSTCARQGNVTINFDPQQSDYDGTITVPYTVNKLDASQCKTTLKKSVYTYNGKTQKPDLSTKDSNDWQREPDLTITDAKGNTIANENYSVVEPNESKAAGNYDLTVNFKKNCTGSIKVPYSIVKANSDDFVLSLSSTKYYYNGKVQKPSVKVLDSKGNAISYDNYNVTYSNANSAALGTYNVTVDFKGNYTGKSITRAYTIAKVPASKCKVSLSSTSYTYNGKSKKPSVTVKYGKTTLQNKKDYTVSYSKGRKNAGIYFATVKFKGYYEGTTKKSFQIHPSGTKIDKITAGNKKLTIKVKKQSKQISGYQIQYSNTKSFKKNINNPNIRVKNITFGKSKNNSKKRTKTAKNLFGKETYYVRARTYKEVKVDGKKKKVYSKWSKAKKITTKGKKSKKTKYTVLIKNKLLKDDKGNYQICNQSVRDNQRGTGMYYGIPDEPTIMVSDAYSDKEYNDYLKRLYKVYKSLKITDKTTDAEKVYKVTKWEYQNFSYNWDYYNGKADRDSGTCGYSALKKKKATCAGYAEIANDLLYLMDIPSYILINKWGNHCWNIVNIDGYWYDFDNTGGQIYSEFVFTNSSDPNVWKSNARKTLEDLTINWNNNGYVYLAERFKNTFTPKSLKYATKSSIKQSTVDDMYNATKKDREYYYYHVYLD